PDRRGVRETAAGQAEHPVMQVRRTVSRSAGRGQEGRILRRCARGRRNHLQDRNSRSESPQVLTRASCGAAAHRGGPAHLRREREFRAASGSGVPQRKRDRMCVMGGQWDNWVALAVGIVVGLSWVWHGLFGLGMVVLVLLGLATVLTAVLSLTRPR